jgi:hypothetical protein
MSSELSQSRLGGLKGEGDHQRPVLLIPKVERTTAHLLDHGGGFALKPGGSEVSEHAGASGIGLECGF